MPAEDRMYAYPFRAIRVANLSVLAKKRGKMLRYVMSMDHFRPNISYRIPRLIPVLWMTMVRYIPSAPNRMSAKMAAIGQRGCAKIKIILKLNVKMIKNV